MDPVSVAAFLDPFYKCLPVPIIILRASDDDQHIVCANPFFYRRSGISEDVTGLSFREMLTTRLGAGESSVARLHPASGLSGTDGLSLTASDPKRTLPFTGVMLEKLEASIPGTYVCAVFDSGSHTSPGAQRAQEKVLGLLQQIETLTRFGTWEIDLATAGMKWSEGMFRITGHDPEEHEINFTTGFDIVHPDDRAPVAQTFERAAVNREAIDTRLRLIARDGSVRHVVSRGVVICDENEVPVRLFGVSQDITDQVLANKQVEDIRLLYQTLVQSVDGIFWEADALTFQVSYISPQVERILGFTAEEWLADPEFWQKQMHTEDRDAALSYCRAETDAGRDHELEYRMYDKNGNVLWVRDVVSVVVENDRPARLRGLLVNITEKKLAELRQQELYAELDARALELTASNRELEQFAYIASHDLQEPLRMVTSFLTQLDRKYGNVLDEKGRQYIYYAVDGAARMRQIILDLLEFSRAGRITVPEENIDLNELMEEIRELFANRIAESGGRVEYGDLPVVVAPRASLLQLLQNLVSNALKYHSPGRPPIVNVAVEREDEHWHFTVSDNGIGVESEYFEKIFVIFQRLHPKHEYSGSGIGLAICKKIADQLGGKIWIESEPDVGSTLHFLLPARNQPPSPK